MWPRNGETGLKTAKPQELRDVINRRGSDKPADNQIAAGPRNYSGRGFAKGRQTNQAIRNELRKPNKISMTRPIPSEERETQNERETTRVRVRGAKRNIFTESRWAWKEKKEKEKEEEEEKERKDSLEYGEMLAVLNESHSRGTRLHPCCTPRQPSSMGRSLDRIGGRDQLYKSSPGTIMWGI